MEDAACIVCGKTDNAAEMLLCDGCDTAGAHHLACLNPPLTSAPEGEWFCPDCVKDQREEEGKPLLVSPSCLPAQADLKKTNAFNQVSIISTRTVYSQKL